MSDLLNIFQQRHQEKLEQLKRGEVDGDFLDEIHALIADLRQAGAVVANSAERGQLRALMRFWGNVAYDRTGVYPNTMLQPLDPDRVPSAEEPSRRSSFPLVWALVGGAAAVVAAVGLVAIGWLPKIISATSGEETLTPQPRAVVSQVVVGGELNAEGAVEMVADTFCLGIPEIVAEFTLEGIEPEMEWRWEVQREGEVVASQDAAPWGEERQGAVIRALTGGREGVEPGQYELLVYVDEQVAGRHSFWVLDTAPRVFNLRVADVPESAEETSKGSGFEAGTRVIYLNYEYEGLCPGVRVSHTLYREGELVQESGGEWSGAPQGQAQVSFQASGDSSFPPGDYEAAAAVRGEEQARVGFTIKEAISDEPVPAFGGVTVALGVRPDGVPVLAAPDNRFDWNTRIVYTIFDYVEMSDGLRWAAVWMRNGEEVSRQEGFWDVEADGTAGTYWVVYYDERRGLLSGGNYSVTLYIDDVVQRTVDFNILYYVPREE